MPLHRHECESCGNRFRVLELPGVESETPTCPVCGSTSTRRLMPLVAVQFKGSGFYKTDRGRKGRARSERGPAETDPKDSGNAEPSRDSKASTDSKGPAASDKTSSAE